MNNIDDMIDMNYIIEKSLRFKTDNFSFNGNNIFGVFVSISYGTTDNIHGCIGYWSQSIDKNINFKVMSNNDIVKWLGSVSYDATWSDSRRYNHKISPYLDLGEKYKIYYMILPVYKITNDGKLNGNTPFNNNDYGLIVNSLIDGRRATYLPGVFMNSKWNDIKDSLLEKANIDTSNYNRENIVYHAYKTIEKECSLLDYYVKPFKKYFDTYRKNYDISIVRNIGFASDLLVLHNYCIKLENDTIVYIKNMCDKYYDTIFRETLNKGQGLRQEDRQALSFLLKCYIYLDNHNESDSDKYKNKCQVIYDYLSYQVNNNYNDLEPNFELCEILESLVLFDKNINLHNKFIKKIINNEVQRFNNLENNNDNIFRYNWIAQYLNSLSNIMDISKCKKYAEFLLKLTKDNIDLTYDYETNYYVVQFQCLTALLNCIGNDDLVTNNIIEHILIKLSYRKMYNNCKCLYLFKDKTYRLDITGHFICGLKNLILVTSK